MVNRFSSYGDDKKAFQNDPHAGRYRKCRNQQHTNQRVYVENGDVQEAVRRFEIIRRNLNNNPGHLSSNPTATYLRNANPNNN